MRFRPKTASRWPVAALCTLLLLGGGTALAVDPALLASTPDANATDPAIVAKATVLGHDAAAIFAFVRDAIGYDAYRGSLRGASGTLAGGAGNALDKASLLVALLRASGIPARYASGTLSDNVARQVILSMFPRETRIVGCLDPGVATADPANDPQLLAEAKEHYWVELDTGSGFQDADPTVPGATLGQAFTAVATTFTEVPDALRHKVEVSVDAETTTPLAGLFGASPEGRATVLDETFATVELAGKALAVGHFVDSVSLGGLFSSTTNTYSPYVLVNQNDADLTDDPVRRGQSYQEQLTNFPFGSQILTGVFLDVTVLGPEANGTRPSQRIEKPLVDRIGAAVRQNGGGGSLALPPNPPPALTAHDITTIEVSTYSEATPQIALQQAALASIQQQLVPLLPDVMGGTAPPETVQLANTLAREGSIESTSLAGSRQLALSDGLARILADRALVHAYFDSPRILAVSTRSTSDQQALSLEIDVLRDTPRAYGRSGQAADAATFLRYLHGLADSVLESQTASALAGQNGTPSAAIDTFLAALATPGASVVPIASEHLTTLADLAISDEAKARITTAATAGALVLVPSTMVSVNGTPTVAWLEIDPATGHAIAVAENGVHQAIVEYSEEFLVSLEPELAAARGAEEAEMIFAEVENLTAEGKYEEAKKFLESAVKAARAIDPIAYGVLAETVGLFKTFLLTERAYKGVGNLGDYASLTDPPVGSLLFEGMPTPDFAGLGGGGGVAAGIVPDALFTVPVGGAPLPTVFRVGLKNLGGAPDTFALDPAQVPAGFTLTTSVPSVTLGAGETGEVSACLRPTGVLPPPGTAASFDVKVTSVSNAAVTATGSQGFTVPAVHAVTLAVTPASATVPPGETAAVSLAVSAVGNVGESVTLDATLPAGLALTGLQTPVVLTPGQTVMQSLGFTPDAGVALGTTLAVSLTASFGNPPSIAGTLVSITTAIPGAAPAMHGAAAADALGNPSLAATLTDLGTAITALFAAPDDPLRRARVLALLDALIDALRNDPVLVQFLDQLLAIRDTIASGDAQQVHDALETGLPPVLTQLTVTLGDLAGHRFTMALLPTAAVAQANTPAAFQAVVQNTGSATSTYAFTVTGLPPGVTSQVMPAQTVVAPGGQATIDVHLMETSPTQLLPAAFRVVATVEEAPDVFQGVQGRLTVADDRVAVVSVTPSPGFTPGGGSIGVTARMFGAVQQARSAKASFAVLDATSQQVRGPSTPVAFGLTVSPTVVPVDLGAFDASGLVPGAYTIHVTASETNGTPIPGASGNGTLLVGTPVTASLTSSPSHAAAGSPTLTSTLTLASQITPPPPLTPRGVVATNGAASTVAVNGTHAYVCGSKDVSVVDVSDPDAPAVVGSFGNDVVTGVTGPVICRMAGGRLAMMVQQSGNFTVATYDLADPVHPAKLGSVFAPRANNNDDTSFANSMDATPSLVLIADEIERYFIADQDLFLQNGQFTAVDIANPATPTVGGTLYPQPTGQGNLWQVTVLDDQTALVVGSTSTGTDTQSGVGRLRTIDVSDPMHPAVLGQLDVPGTVHLVGVGVDGRHALLAGTQGGWRDFFSPDFHDYRLLGMLVLAVADVSDPAHPQLLGTPLTTSLDARFGAFIAPLGGGLFALFPTLAGAQQQLVVVDASDPASLGVFPVDVPVAPASGTSAGGRLYETSSVGLSIFDVGGLPLTASVEVPHGPGVTIVPDSFSLAPSQVVVGADSDKLVWSLSLLAAQTPRNITWRSQAPGLQAGETRPVTLGATVDFTANGTPGTLALPGTTVAGVQILGLTPSARTVAPGAPADFTLGLTNPTDASATYALAVAGVAGGLADLPPSVTLGAGESTSIPFTLRSAPDAAPGPLPFDVAATAADGTDASVPGTLTLQGAPVVDPTAGLARGVLVQLSPTLATGGQGSPAFFLATVINTGTVADSFAVTVDADVPGVDVTGPGATVAVPAGASRVVGLVLVPQAGGVAAGSVGFTVTATSTTSAAVHGAARGELEVSDLGVTVGIASPSVVAGGSFQATITNTGGDVDTFTLTLAGAAAPFAAFGTTLHALGSGQSQMIQVNVGPIAQAVAGALDLTLVATSQGTPSVRGSASISVTIPAAKAVAASFVPPTRHLAAAGGATFQLQVQNVGNVEDAYTAAIVGTNGPVQAALHALDGTPTTMIPIFRVRGQGAAGLTLDADLSSLGQGTVTVRITSLSDPTVTTTATAMLLATPATTTTMTLPPPCGNGVVDPGEACDPLVVSSCAAGFSCGAAGTPDACRCVPKVREICGNCIDDDGNKLIDAEDGACCEGASPAPMTLRSARLRTRAGTTRLALSASVPGARDLDPTRQDVLVQLHQEQGGELLCARIPATAFSHKGRVFRFRDRKNAIASARGLELLKITVTKDGTAKIVLTGRRVQSAAGRTGSLRFTLGFRDPASAVGAGRCPGVLDAFRASHNGGLRFP